MIDQLKESERQSAIFRGSDHPESAVDLARLRATLAGETQIPSTVIDAVLARIRANIEHLGLEKPPARLIGHWVTALLREQGHHLGDISLQTLELSLTDVEMNIHHPLGSGLGADQNPEASSQRIASRIKTQFATRRVYQSDVVKAHDDGWIELLHLGAIDRPHDVFLTPDYLKVAGLPAHSGAPSSGPARRADVLLAHLIRFSHELQNHFAGDIQWGYLNTLLLPFLSERSESDMRQFVQHLLFEFGQLDTERGGLQRKVVLDLDFDMPRQLKGLPALGPGGEALERCYGDFQATLDLFNEVLLDLLEQGDAEGKPFHAPLMIFHCNQPELTWNHRLQRLLHIAMQRGNPSIAFSFYERNFGPLGRIRLNDPDFLRTMQHPAELRGFSSSSIALNLPRLTHPALEGRFEDRLAHVMEIAVSAHRQKRLFLSRLMAYGNRGPLQFLRHKAGHQPFLKIAGASQPLQLIGLSEAAALANGSPLTPPEVLAAKARDLVSRIRATMLEHNRCHKLQMLLSSTRDENVAYRFAALDLRQRGSGYSPYVLHRPDQAHPIYTEGTNILPFVNLRWRERMSLEAPLHALFAGPCSYTLYLEQPNQEDQNLAQKIFQHAVQSGIAHLQLAPDLLICRNCQAIFGERQEACPSCRSTLVSAFGLCQSGFSPVHTWCLGKRSEWKLRHRMDSFRPPIQTNLPW